MLENRLKESLLKILEDKDNGIYRTLEMIDAINHYDNSLENLNYYENDEEFFNMFFYNNPMEAVRASYYGDYKYLDEYVKIDLNGNLKSSWKYELYFELTENVNEIIDRLVELMEKDSDIKEIVDELLENESVNIQ